MTPERSAKNVIDLIRFSLNTLFQNPLIAYPFVIIAFIQLFVLEIFYFAPRYPLSIFFGPLIRTLYGEGYLHYPYNFILLPKMFQYAQIFIYIFISSFLIAVSVATIEYINNDKKVTFGMMVKKMLPQYVHICLASIFMFMAIFGFLKLYGLAYDRASLIQSTSGKFYLIKRLVMEGASYITVLIQILVTTIFAYVITLIAIEKRKVFSALWKNFRYLRTTFFFIFSMVLIPTLFYLPVLVLRDNMPILGNGMFPSLRGWVIVLSILVLTAIDSIIYTAVTSFYLLKQEHR